MKLKNRLLTFLKSDDGATAVEYCVMLAGVLLALIIGLLTAGGGVSSWWTNIQTDLQGNGI